MKKIITIYRGDDPRELERIKLSLETAEIHYYKSVFIGFVGSLFDRLVLSLFSPFGIVHNSYYENKGYHPDNFEIKVLERDEAAARTILTSLSLSQPMIPSNPSLSNKVMQIIDWVPLRLILICGLLAIYYFFGGKIAELYHGLQDEVLRRELLNNVPK